MPKLAASRRRRRELAQFVKDKGAIMVSPCSFCRRHNHVCRVHIRSGNCSECLRRGNRCDLRISRNEFRKLREERVRLDRELEQSRAAQDAARQALQAAQRTELRVLSEMDSLLTREAEAIAVEEADIIRQEAEEAAASAEISLPDLSTVDFGPSLLPEEWQTFDPSVFGIPLESSGN